MFALFTEGDVVGEGPVVHVIVPEGALLVQIANLVAGAEGLTLDIDADYLLALWSDTDFLAELIEAYWFLTDDILNPELYYPLEGYITPIRHEIPEGVEDGRALTVAMLNMTQQRLAGVREQVEAHEMTFHEILSFAAIIEAETQDVDEKSMVAGVFQNRLDIEMLLQTDVTVQYIAAERQTQVTYEMLGIDSPFNTYRHFGLPPGPVNSPSVQAIEAAMEPESHDYIFFISDMFGCVGEPGNKNYFTNFEDHLAFYHAHLRPSYDAGYSVCNPDVQLN